MFKRLICFLGIHGFEVVSRSYSKKGYVIRSKCAFCNKMHTQDKKLTR